MSPSAARAQVSDPWTDLGHALAGLGAAPALTAAGSANPGSHFELRVSGAAPNAPAAFVLGVTHASLPLFGGTLVPAPDLVLPTTTDAAGAATLLVHYAAALPLGVPIHAQAWILEQGTPLAVASTNALSTVGSAGPEWGTFPDEWIWGGSCATDPKWQVHAYNPDFFILRQSVCTHFEAPFLYLLPGTQKALLIDTGASSNVPTAQTVTAILQQWAAERGIPVPQLEVVHSHSHGDHVAGDSQFQGLPGVVVCGTSLSAVQNFFGFTQWPTQVVTKELGGRTIDVLAIPGHHATSLAFYDRRTATLLTGDSLYPGRLYVFGAVAQGNWNVYKQSVRRLVAFTTGKPLAWVLGTHIEMTDQPGVDFPAGASSHPSEHVLELTRSHLLELDAALEALPGPQVDVHDDFIITPIG